MCSFIRILKAWLQNGTTKQGRMGLATTVHAAKIRTCHICMHIAIAIVSKIQVANIWTTI